VSVSGQSVFEATAGADVEVEVELDGLIAAVGFFLFEPDRTTARTTATMTTTATPPMIPRRFGPRAARRAKGFLDGSPLWEGTQAR
jgi:hypothetical protein